MLQEDLDTTSHSTEELIEKRQILNSVLIEQVSQTCEFQTAESQRSELLLYFKRHSQSDRQLDIKYYSCICLYKAFTVVYLFAEWLWDVHPATASPQSQWAAFCSEKKKRSGYKWIFVSVLNYKLNTTLTVCSGLDMWWLCRPPLPSVCWHDGDILVPIKEQEGGMAALLNWYHIVIYCEKYFTKASNTQHNIFLSALNGGFQQGSLSGL